MNKEDKQLNIENTLVNKTTQNTNNNIHDTMSIQNEKIKNLKLQILNNQKKIRDIELRNLANIENTKKHTQDEIKNIKNIEIQKFLIKIIPIIDSLEDLLALSTKLNIRNEAVIKGIELTLQSFFDILYKLGVKIEGQKNELFNSKIHTPVFVDSIAEIKPNHIISTIKKGFSFHKILLRKATVTVSKN